MLSNCSDFSLLLGSGMLEEAVLGVFYSVSLFSVVLCKSGLVSSMSKHFFADQLSQDWIKVISPLPVYWEHRCLHAAVRIHNLLPNMSKPNHNARTRNCAWSPHLVMASCLQEAQG